MDRATTDWTVSARAALLGVTVLLVVEFGALGFVFKHAIGFECRANWPESLCNSVNMLMSACYGALGALALFMLLVPGALRQIEKERLRLRPLVTNAAGVLLALVPVLLIREGMSSATVWLTIGIWTVAVPMILAGPLLVLAPVARWATCMRTDGKALALTLVAGALIPPLANGAQALWTLDWLVDATFAAVVTVLNVANYDIVGRAGEAVIGADGFFVSIDKVCSGIEGIALVTLFVTLYLLLFRRDMRFPLALILYPLALAASLGFNVLRIAVLLVIGIEGYPELAVGGFHSHAGWVTFTLVALGIIVLADAVPQLKHAQTGQVAAARQTGPPPLWHDPVAARILPFAVFMLGALVVSTVSQTPGVLYPLRIFAVGAVLALFWPLYRALPWRADPVALCTGTACGLLWLVTAAPQEAADTELAARLGTMPPFLFGLWAFSRVVGTVVFVPLVEELFFRGYVLDRLEELISRAGPHIAAGLALAVSSVAFGLLHDRWLAGILAGVLFGLLYMRRRNLADPILGHAVANLIIALAALWGGDWSLI